MASDIVRYRSTRARQDRFSEWSDHTPSGQGLALLNGRAGISPEMAVRLSIAFNASSESWLNQQVQYDLWHAEKNRRSLRVEKLSAA